MAKQKQEFSSDRVIEMVPIRLSADETRLIIRAANSKEPLTPNYSEGRYTSLVELGLMVQLPEDMKAKKLRLDSGWKAVFSATQKRDRDAVRQALRVIEDNNKSKYAFALTALGKEVARGISVRLASQFNR
jgi:hypothetical protein